jgi:RNA polymerase sigma-70 factor (ECF subfamily)
MDSETSDIQQMLQLAASGDSAATASLLVSQRQRLKRMVEVRLDRRVAGRVDPSDVVQDVLMKAAGELPAYLRERAVPFYPWLRRLAWQHLVDLHRRHVISQKRSVLREEQLQLSDNSTIELAQRLIAPQSTPSGVAVKRELSQRLRGAMTQLKDSEREVLILKYLEQLSSAEIADVMGLAQRTIQAQHRQALEKLHRALGESDPCR